MNFEKHILPFGFFLVMNASLPGAELPYMVLAATIFLHLAVAVIKTACGSPSPFILRVPVIVYHDSVIEYMALKYLYHCWWIIPATWVWGVSNALMHDVPAALAFRNFFGMIVYATFPFLLSKHMTIQRIIEIVIYSAFVQMAYLASGFITLFKNIAEMANFQSLSELRAAYSLGSIILFPLLSISAASLFYSGWRQRIMQTGTLTNLLFNKKSFIILIVIITLPSMSKGLFLITVLITAIPFYFGTAESFQHTRITWPVVIVIALIPIGIYLIPQSLIDLILFTFSTEESSNALRSEQYYYLVNEFTLLGSGLGSLLKSGYMRDEVGYGFELNYLNIIHKLGIFSIPLFLSYLATVIIALRRIWKRTQLLQSYFVMGLMGYLIQGSANPILLSSTTVLLHCFAIYILLFTPQWKEYAAGTKWSDPLDKRTNQYSSPG